MATVYEINKGINRSLEFRGIKAQYVVYLAIGLIFLLLLFTLLYSITKNAYLCLGIVVPSTAILIATVQRFSKKYGENGLTKKMANSRLPGSITSSSRKLFISFNKTNYEKGK